MSKLPSTPHNNTASIYVWARLLHTVIEEMQRDIETMKLYMEPIVRKEVKSLEDKS